MYDHTYIREGGERVPVSKMTLAEIEEALKDGVRLDQEGIPATEAEVLTRLQIELIIRTFSNA